MKTPEEIKTALKICSTRSECDNCPYDDGKCENELERDALEYIEKLEVILNVTIPGTPKEEDDDEQQ